MNAIQKPHTQPIGNCAEHGDYSHRDGYAGHECPTCLHKAAAERSWLRSNVPVRFRGRTLGMFATEAPEQSDALSLMRAYADDFEKHAETGASLVLCGKPGTGKTHLACGTLQAVAMRHAVTTGYVTAADMIRAIRSTYARNSDDTEEKVIERFSDVALLVIDEVGVTLGTEHERQLFYVVLNRRYERFRPTIIISNLPHKDLSDFLGERVIDRLKEGGGRILAFNGESYRTRDNGLPTRSGCPQVRATPFFQKEDGRFMGCV